MLDPARNQLLTQTGADTPMGQLLRRYWHPIAAVAELEDTSIKPVRLLGEDLVLYRDASGNHGLVARHCPHRRADLSYGFTESCGLRCNYHGWLFDHTGACLERPFEDTVNPDGRATAQMRITAYPVRALAGLLWAYLGPAPVPELPVWEPFTWPNGYVQIVFSEIPCNWVQCQENSIDPVHFEWMHDNWSIRLRNSNRPYAARHLKVRFDEFDHGIAYKRVREGGDETSELWTVGRVCLWPNALFTGNHFEWRVPIDDTTTLSIGWFFNRVPREREPYHQSRIPAWHSPVKDPETGRLITSHIMNQDFVGWIGQGTIADRSGEHLGQSDRGVVMMRNRFFADLEEIAAGRDPKAIIRDPKLAANVDLPIVDRKRLTEGLPADEHVRNERDHRARSDAYNDGFVFLYGQPEEIRNEFEDVMMLR
jgi:5,5'-dehydrodivanillate O-demethylase oxygenase subunit